MRRSSPSVRLGMQDLVADRILAKKRVWIPPISGLKKDGLGLINAGKNDDDGVTTVKSWRGNFEATCFYLWPSYPETPVRPFLHLSFS